MGVPVRGANQGAFATARNEEKRDRDPYLGLRFGVEINSIVVALFTECSAPTMETEMYEYAEGGENGFTHKLPVRHKYGNLTLKSGMDEGHDLWEWYQKAIDGKAQRLDITIHIYGQVPGRAALRTYQLRRAIPVKWTGPDMKADNGAIAVETLELAHEGLTITRNKE